MKPKPYDAERPLTPGAGRNALLLGAIAGLNQALADLRYNLDVLTLTAPKKGDPGTSVNAEWIADQLEKLAGYARNIGKEQK
jgi:hypothetical protein